MSPGNLLRYAIPSSVTVLEKSNISFPATFLARSPFTRFGNCKLPNPTVFYWSLDIEMPSTNDKS